MNLQQKKENLNVVIANDTKPQEYIDYLNLYYNVIVIEHKDIKEIDDIDLVLFTGGADVNPEQYNEKIGKFTQIDIMRDLLELDIFYKFRYKPKLGICRGAQLLTVLSGGTLIQHVEGHTQDHLITIKDYGDYQISSTHHQMMYPFNLKKEKYNLIGWSSKFRSSTYLNGEDKEIDIFSNFLEPEIVEYFDSNSFCIQGHPENSNENTKQITISMIYDFIHKHKKNNYTSFYDNDFKKSLEGLHKAKTNNFNLKPNIEISNQNRNISYKLGRTVYPKINEEIFEKIKTFSIPSDNELIEIDSETINNVNSKQYLKKATFQDNVFPDFLK